ncbi:lipase member H-like [Photinus pyralis]|uniref:lipase member H-like n=1 Tax=Photinus pyralis TaxID=7054 RepID=UPI00126775DE|nr:lipase member H-like [Photinus pyralis]
MGYGVEAQPATICPNVWTFTLYTTAYPNGTTDISEAAASNQTVIIVHGWEQCATQSWILRAKDAHLAVEERNVIALDWSKEAMNAWYPSSAQAVPAVGIFLGEAIYEWVRNGTITLATTRLVGFSLGAHVCAFAGQVYQNKTGGENLTNIIALDPAKELFESKPVDERLDAGDATMVQVFHTIVLKTCGNDQLSCPYTPGVPIDNLLLAACKFRASIKITIFCSFLQPHTVG